MNIYLIESIESVGYDCYDSFCIVTNSEEEVREIAQKCGANETETWDTSGGKLKSIEVKFWTVPQKTKIQLVGKYIGEETESFILIASFNAG